MKNLIKFVFSALVIILFSINFASAQSEPYLHAVDGCPKNHGFGIITCWHCADCSQTSSGIPSACYNCSAVCGKCFGITVGEEYDIITAYNADLTTTTYHAVKGSWSWLDITIDGQEAVQLTFEVYNP